MTFKMTRTNVWSAEIKDEPGELARRLRAITDFGADLDCVIARRCADQSGKGVVFVSPLDEKKLSVTPDQAEFHELDKVPTLKIEGTNQAGTGAKITKAIGNAGINMHGLSASVIGHKYVCYIGFDTIEDLKKAEEALDKLREKRPLWHRPTLKKRKAKTTAKA